MEIRLEPHDEGTHDPGDDPTFNESMYVNVYDPSAGLGVFFRIGNRPNEGRAEVTTCAFLPGGRVGFMFGRPHIEGNAVLDAGGMRFEVTRPFEEMEVAYDGTLCILDDPLQMADPKEAFTTNPHVPCRAELTCTGVSTMFGGEPSEPIEGAGEGFAKAHYEQLMAVSGRLTIGDDSYPLDGHGLRDHSWGPRTWQAPWYYRWLTGNVGGEFGFMCSRVASRTGPGTRGGFVWDGGEMHLCPAAEIRTGWTGDGYHETVEFDLRAGDRTWSVKGEVMTLIPLRNRRDGQVTRIAEGLTRWTTSDGRTGYGLSEYLDQIVDGEPVGRDE